jgi:site-specific DNA recombinase
MQRQPVLAGRSPTNQGTAEQEKAMALMLAKLYTALREAGADDDKAREAAETLNTFLTRLRSSAGALDVSERQRIMRLLVKEVLVGDDKIIIRHCIPLPNRSGDGPPDGGINTAPPGTEGYLLRSRSPVAVAVQHRAR